MHGVSDVESALKSRGVGVVPYQVDTAHTYFKLPGGPVFRLAEAS